MAISQHVLSILPRVVSSLFLSLLILCFCACEQMLDYIPQAALAEAAIGTAGGELAVDELSLHIPAGCFDQTETIGVYVNGASGPYHESSYTQRYEIQGLPFVLSKPIRIQIAYSGEPLDEAYISIEREHTGPGTPENELFYFPIEAVDSSGYLVAYLPEFGLDTLKSTTKTNTATKPTSLTIEGLWIKKSKLTDDGHFKLIWPYNETKPEHLNLIGAYLEGAYKYFNLPPSYQLDAIYSRLPKITKVHFTKSQGNTESIWVAADYGGFGEYILNVNTTGSDFANPELLHSKVYAAFYQLVHLTTLPYLRIFTHNLGVTLGGVPTATAAQMNEDFLWFSSACGAWAETLITENRQYLFSSTAAASFKGYQFAHGKGDFLVEEHGIGMGLQLYFLTEKFGTEILLKTWTNGEAEMKTLDVVLMNQVTLPVDWLQDYYQTFILTYPAIFDIDLQTLVDETVEIKSGEKEYSIEGEYLDMSAKLYNLVIDPDDYMNKDLEFRLQGADWKYNNITLFTHNEQFGDVKFLDTGGTSLKLINVGDELDQNQHILAMVSHLRAITPYYDLVPITFEINVTEKEFESIAMDFQLLGYFNGVLSDGSEVENYANAVGSTIPTFNWEGLYHYPPEINIDGNHIAQTWDFTPVESGDKMNYTGQLELVMSDDKKTILGFSLHIKNTATDPTSWTQSIEISLTSTSCAIPRENTFPISEYRIEDQRVCTILTTVAEKSTSRNNGHLELQNYECNEGSYITFEFIKN